MRRVGGELLVCLVRYRAKRFRAEVMILETNNPNEIYISH
jgi:hypothetical protein